MTKRTMLPKPLYKVEGLAVAYDMGRDDVINSGDYRADMFIYNGERVAYDRGWQQEAQDLATLIRAMDNGCR